MMYRYILVFRIYVGVLEWQGLSTQVHACAALEGVQQERNCPVPLSPLSLEHLISGRASDKKHKGSIRKRE